MIPLTQKEAQELSVIHPKAVTLVNHRIYELIRVASLSTKYTYNYYKAIDTSAKFTQEISEIRNNSIAITITYYPSFKGNPETYTFYTSTSILTNSDTEWKDTMKNLKSDIVKDNKEQRRKKAETLKAMELADREARRALYEELRTEFE